MKLRTKEVIFLGYFLAIFLLRKIGAFSFSLTFLKNSSWEAIFWFLGAFLGGYFIKLEQLVYVFYIHPAEPLSLEIKNLVNQKLKKEVWRLLKERVSEQKLAFRSVLFQAAWLGVAIFTLTSTSSLFGKTLVMGIGFHLILDEWEDLLGRRSLAWLFWQIKREIGAGEQKKFVWLMTGVYGILSLLLI